MTLTKEDIQRLQAPFEPDEHEVREKGLTKAKDKTLWLTYIEEGPVIERLNEIDPNWTLEITRVNQTAEYVATYGRLTLCGVSREGVGTNSPNRTGDAVGEDEEKGAATDMLKRLARLFGVGLYLKNAPTIYTPAEMKPWDGKADALKQYTKWHNERFGSPTTQQRQQLGGGDKPRRIPTPENPKPVDAAPPAELSDADRQQDDDIGFDGTFAATKAVVKRSKNDRLYIALIDRKNDSVSVWTRSDIIPVLPQAEGWTVENSEHLIEPPVTVFYKNNGKFKDFVRVETDLQDIPF